MSKLSIPETLSKRKGKPISNFIYYGLQKIVANPFLIRPMNVEVEDRIGAKDIKGPFIVVSNHTSRCDWMYVSKAIYPHKVNFMIAYNEFFRKKMHLVFDLIHAIPKRNFTSDLHSIKEMMQVIQASGNVAFFPEGKSSISGTNQPCMLGTGKLFSHIQIPVYYVRITGGYMSNTQWNIANRPGKVKVVFDRLFTAEEVKTLAPEEMEKRLNEAIYNDDFEWNKTARIKYKKNDTVAIKLEEHLYKCPKCGVEFQMIGEKNVIKCLSCGNGALINEYYDLVPLDENAVLPKTLRVWYELQRRAVYREIKANENFSYSEKVKLGILPTDHYIKDNNATSEYVGEGVFTVDRNSISFKGTKNGEPFEFTNDILNVPSLILATDSSYFATYYKGEYLEFMPERKATTKILLATEECHRISGGKWQNSLPQQQWIYEDDKPSDKENYYL